MTAAVLISRSCTAIGEPFRPVGIATVRITLGSLTSLKRTRAGDGIRTVASEEIFVSLYRFLPLSYCWLQLSSGQRGRSTGHDVEPFSSGEAINHRP